jgi:hypothetical protein
LVYNLFEIDERNEDMITPLFPFAIAFFGSMLMGLLVSIHHRERGLITPSEIHFFVKVTKEKV